MLMMTKKELLEKCQELALYPGMLAKAMENPEAYMTARGKVDARELREKFGVGNGNSPKKGEGRQ